MKVQEVKPKGRRLIGSSGQAAKGEFHEHIGKAFQPRRSFALRCARRRHDARHFYLYGDGRHLHRALCGKPRARCIEYRLSCAESRIWAFHHAFFGRLGARCQDAGRGRCGIGEKPLHAARRCWCSARHIARRHGVPFHGAYFGASRRFTRALCRLPRVSLGEYVLRAVCRSDDYIQRFLYRGWPPRAGISRIIDSGTCQCGARLCVSRALRHGHLRCGSCDGAVGCRRGTLGSRVLFTL